MRYLIIIGVNGSLGRGATRTLVDGNYDKVYLCDRKPIDWIDDSDRITKINIGDISSEGEVKKLFEQIEVNASSEYYLFSTVGGFYSSTVKDIKESDLLDNFNINIKSAMLISKYFYKLASDTIGGSICFTSAFTAQKASAGKSVYGAFKAALNYFVQSLSLEGEEINLTVNVVAPFALDTPENREWVSDKKKLASPGDIGKIVNTLFEEHPGSTGKIVKVPENIE